MPVTSVYCKKKFKNNSLFNIKNTPKIYNPHKDNAAFSLISEFKNNCGNYVFLSSTLSAKIGDVFSKNSAINNRFIVTNSE